jgi:WD40 repeat protein
MITPADSELLQVLLDGQLPAEQSAAVEARLKSDHDFAHAFVALVREQVVLRRWAASVATLNSAAAESCPLAADRLVQPAAASARRSRTWTGVVVAALVLVAVAVAYRWNRPAETGPVPEVSVASTPEHLTNAMARLEDVQGEVYIVAAAGPIRAGSGKEISAGQEVQVRGENSSAVMRYSDGTRLDLGPDTSLRILADSAPQGGSAPPSKRIYFAEGTLVAEVTPQPEGQPMLVSTPHAEIVAPGTRFSSYSGQESTSVELDEGTVQFTRKKDGKTIEVNSGSYGVATANVTAFAPQTMPPRISQPHLSLVEGSGPVMAVVLSPDGKRLASGGWDGTVRLWDPASGNQQAVLGKHPKKIVALAFAPDGQALASGSEDRSVRVWNLAREGDYVQLTGLRDVRSVAFSPDGSALAVGGASKRGGEIKLFDLPSGKEIGSLLGHTQAVTSLAISPDGQTLGSASRDGTVKLWDWVGHGERANLRGHTAPVNAIAYSRDGDLVAAASNNGTVIIWESATGMVRKSFVNRGGSVAAIAFSSDGKMLLTGGAGGATLWDIATGDEVTTIRAHKYMFPSIALSRDGRMLATAGWDKTVKIWDLTQKPEPAPERPTEPKKRK